MPRISHADLFHLAAFIAIFSTAAILSLPFLQTPPAATVRLLDIVHSEREDKRRIRWSERIAVRFLKDARNLRTRLGLAVSAKAKTRLAVAGFRSPYAADTFFGAQSLLLIAGGALGTLFPDNTLFWILIGTVLGFMAPDIWLSDRIERRKKRIRRGIPDTVDLLVICVDAGLGLDQALLRIGQDLGLSHPDLNEELTRMRLERQAGTPRLEAWRNLADRTRVEELSAFVTMLTETDRFGTPITRALSGFSEELRLRRRQHAEEAAAKTKIKIIFPLVLCIFPCIFIVLLAPAMLSIAKGLSSMSQ